MTGGATPLLLRSQPRIARITRILEQIEYLQPAVAGDRLVVRTWVADMQRVSSLRRYEIVRESDGTVLARAETRWAFIDLHTRKPARIPLDVQADFVIVRE